MLLWNLEPPSVSIWCSGILNPFREHMLLWNLEPPSVGIWCSGILNPQYQCVRECLCVRFLVRSARIEACAGT